MNEEVKQAWVDLLRSGDIEQTTAALHNDNDEMCCLGVLCKIAEERGIVTRSEAPISGAYVYQDPDLTADQSAVALPDKVRRWAGLSDHLGFLTYAPGEEPYRAPFKKGDPPESGYELGHLAQINDSGAYTFSQIADIIEKHF